MEALYLFHTDIKRRADLCVAHEQTAAVHMTNSKALQIYRLYPSQVESLKHFRLIADALPTWEEANLWDFEGNNWERVERNVNARMKKHKKLHPIFTRGISWNGNPILIHAYKFEPDSLIKVELIVPDSRRSSPQFALHALSDVLECHELLVPKCFATPLPPYTRHEAKFLTPLEHLSRTLPEDLYTLCSFPSRS